MSSRFTASGEFFLADSPVEQLLRETRQPAPQPAELGRVFATVCARLERRKQRWTRVAVVGVPIACAVALAVPIARQTWSATSRPEAVWPEPAIAAATPASAPTVVPVADQTPIAVAQPAHPRHRFLRHAGTVPAAKASADPVDLDAETQRLQLAIVQLRQAGNASGALSTLDDYLRAYAKPHFGPEARFFRVQALVALGRREEALAEITPERLTVLPRRAELSVLRAELLLQLGRASEARGAFDLALSQVHEEALMVRALEGRAAAGRELTRAAE